MHVEMANDLGCTLGELGDRISSEEYSLRLRFQDGSRSLTNELIAQLLAMFYNVYRAKNQPARQATDWLPQTPVMYFEQNRPTTGADAFAFIAELEKVPLPVSAR